MNDIEISSIKEELEINQDILLKLNNDLKKSDKRLDNVISNFSGGELVTIASSSENSLNALMLNIVSKVALNDKKYVALFNLSIMKNTLTSQLISLNSNIDYQKLQNGNLEKSDWELYLKTKEILSKSNIYFSKISGITIYEIRRMCAEIYDSSENRLNIILIDNLQQLAIASNLTEIEVMQMLKVIALEYIVTIVIGTLFDTKEKNFSNLRLSNLRKKFGKIESNLDTVFFLNERLNLEDKIHTLLELHIISNYNRFNDRKFNLILNRNTFKICDIEEKGSNCF